MNRGLPRSARDTRAKWHNRSRVSEARPSIARVIARSPIAAPSSHRSTAPPTIAITRKSSSMVMSARTRPAFLASRSGCWIN